MTLRRVRGGDVLAGAAGAALLGLLFAPWFYAIPGRGNFAVLFGALDRLAVDRTAWQSLTVVLAFLLLAAFLGLAVLGLTAFERSPALPTAAAMWSLPVALLAAIGVVVRLIDPPNGGDVRWGAWAGLACVLAIPAGAMWSLREDVRA